MLKLAILIILVVDVVLCSKKTTTTVFGSVNEKSKVWNLLQYYEENALKKLKSAVDSRFSEVTDDTNELLKDLHEHDEHVKKFVESVKENYSNMLLNVFNKELQREENQICTKRLHYQAIAFKAVEEYYAKSLDKILGKYNTNLRHVRALLLDFLTDHRGFGPVFGITYVPPKCHKQRLHLEKEFHTMRTRVADDCKNGFQIKLKSWLVHRYLERNFHEKLNSLVQKLEFSSGGRKYIETGFSINDEKYIENSKLCEELADCKDVDFKSEVMKEISSFVKKLGNVIVLRDCFVHHRTNAIQVEYDCDFKY